VPPIRIGLQHEPAIRPVEIANLPFNDAVDVRQRQTTGVAELVHEPFELTPDVDWAAVPVQLRFEGASSGAPRVALQQRVQFVEADQALLFGAVQDRVEIADTGS
jgi:hypothetical protein